MLPYVKFYPRDYLLDPHTRCLTHAEHGIYLLLLFHAWCNATDNQEPYLIDEDRYLSSAIGPHPGISISQIRKKVISIFWTLNSGKLLTNKRLTSEWRSCRGLAEVRSRSSQARWSKPNAHNAASMQMQCNTDTEADTIHNMVVEGESEGESKPEIQEINSILPFQDDVSPKQVSEKPKVKRSRRIPTPSIPLPESFEVTEAMSTWCAQTCPDVDVHIQTDQFRDSAVANARVYSDWPAAWRTWMRNAQSWGNGHHKPKKEITEYERLFGKRS